MEEQTITKIDDTDIFNNLSEDWGGMQDSHEIAEELHNDRVTKEVEAW